MKKKTVCLFCFFSLCVYANILAQEASFTGTIYSENEEPVIDAHIFLQSKNSNQVSKNAVSDTEGTFVFEHIEPGLYTLIIQSIGFEDLNQAFSFSSGELKDEVFHLNRKTYQAGRVVITASRTRKDFEDVSVPVTVVGKEEIGISGNTRINEVLFEQIGITTVSDHGSGIQVQGFDPDYTLILIDNQPLIGRSAGTLDLSRISVGNIEQIEIVKGPSSALWGSDALAGVINIITKKSRQPFEWGVNGQYGSHGSYDTGTNFSFKKEKLSGNFYGNLHGFGGFDLDKTSLAPTVPEYQNYTFSGGVEYELSDILALNLKSRFYREDQSYADEIDIEESAVRVDGADFQEDYNIQPALNFDFGKTDLDAIFYFSGFKSESKMDYADDGHNYYLSFYDQSLTKSEIKSSHFWDNNQITTVGFGGQKETLNSENYSESPEFNSGFVFGQHEFHPVEKLSFTAGFRYDIHSEYSSQFSPKFSALYKASEKIHIRGSLGSGFKAPAFRQLFLNFTNPTVGYSVFGTANIQSGIERLQNEGRIEELYINTNNLDEITSESSFAFNLGFELFPQKGIQIRINAFRNNVQDLIDTQPVAEKTNGQFVYSYFNLNQIYTQGVETELRMEVPGVDGLSANIGYQFLDTQRLVETTKQMVENGQVVTREVEFYTPMTGRSRHTGNLKLFYNLEKYGLETSLRLQYRGRYPFADLNANDKIDDGEYALEATTFEEMAKKTIINASVAKTFFGRYQLQAGINNLTNYKNTQFMPSNPGRTFYTQINIKLY